MSSPKLRKRPIGQAINSTKDPEIEDQGSTRQKSVHWKKFLQKTGYGLGISLVLLIGLVIWAGQDLPDPDRLNQRVSEQSTKMYDRTGQHLLYEIYADKKRTIVELDQIPRYLIDGVIATEDKEFYQHGGIRPLSIARSMVYGILGKGRIGGGASTLTQQLVKNAILTNERSLSRKIKELILSVWLEQKYSKDEILKIYFNEIPYGSTNYGIESAAQGYFGKHVSDLTLVEAATLAGLPQKPSIFLNNLDALKVRRNFVLQRMVEENYLTAEEAERAKAEPLTLKRELGKKLAPHFVEYVQQQLVTTYGENLVERGGLKVLTTLDWDKQQIAEKAIQDKGKELFEQGGANNAGLLALDPRTSQILAMVGSRDYYDESIKGYYNVTTLAHRQPGSSIKPIIYAAAFSKGYTPQTVLYDVVTPFGTSANPYIPQNYDFSEHGPVTMRQALQGSLNIPAVKTLYLVGLKQGISFAEKLGYSTLSEGNFGLSLVLGGGEVRMIEHVNAYAALANNGARNSPVSILSVEDPKGNKMYEWKPQPGEQVMDSKVASMISNVLSDDASRAFVFGAGSSLMIPGRPVAAKSGTTNNYVDAWQLGYTPSLVAGVWAGNTDNHPMKKGFGGSKIAGQMWNYFMREALKNTPVEKFPNLPPNTSSKPVLNGASGGQVKLLVDKITGKLATSSTPENYIVERTYLFPHDILHYVNKDDPQGQSPTNPAQDPAYVVWEQAVQNWIGRRKIKDPNWEVSFENPPTEYDDVHSLESLPLIEVLSPKTNEAIRSRIMTFTVKAQAPRGVTKITYKIDDQFVGVAVEAPFTFQYEAKTLVPGNHTLKVIAEDDVGNRVNVDVPFTLEVQAEPAGLFFEKVPASLSLGQFPITLFLKPFRPGEIKEAYITAVSPDNEKTLVSKIYDLNNLFDGYVTVPWNSVSKNGSWKLVAEVELKSGEIRTSDVALVELN